MSSETFIKPRRRPGAINSLQIMFAAILAIGLILAINFSTRISESQPLQQAYARIQDEIARLQAENAALIARRDYVRSDAYVESWARSDGKMIRQGDILIVPVPGTASLQSSPAPTVSVQPLEPEETIPTWTLWWALFFDSPPPDF
jgi:cell division protein FtsB